MAESQKSPLARLVLFIVCLSIAGSIIAGVYYFAIGLPQQNTLQAPENSACADTCRIQFNACAGACGDNQLCRGLCNEVYLSCAKNTCGVTIYG
jgi:hypothetical protein